MPKAKEGKRKTKGALLPIPILQKFLKTYEKYCAQSQTSVCPAIKKDLKKSIDSERILKKFTLVKPSSPRIVPPISLEPLLMTIRDECYKLGKEMCIWGFQLSNPEVARLALFLESKGHTTCPFTTLEIVDCKMDLWSLERLGKALQLSSLRSLVLDYCNELHLDGNSLLCSGALALLRPIAEYAEMKEKDGMAPPVSPDTATPSQLLQMSQRGSSLLGQTAKSSEAGTAKTTLGKKKNKKGIKKKAKALAEAGPWLVKLHLADNGIDGKEGEHLVEFTRILTCLIRFSAHLREVDLGSNALGEMAAADILQALRARKTGKLPILKITVTPQISSDTFTSIWKNSKKSKTKTIQKKKKMAKTRI
ncbi:uncharacterized protein [Dipodomys merriami]|uniref:uncharacterized protein isoform X2 n=1 Tax=Dipodomys merriami TaxID=94247 RepID=UPI003855A6C6